jgi:hypothetical protein
MSQKVAEDPPVGLLDRLRRLPSPSSIEMLVEMRRRPLEDLEAASAAGGGRSSVSRELVRSSDSFCSGRFASIFDSDENKSGMN